VTTTLVYLSVRYLYICLLSRSL